MAWIGLIESSSTGDITSVVAGTGLSGGATSGAATLNVDAAQTQITSIGTIGTGVWQGTAIASAYLDADTAHLSGSQTFTGTKTLNSFKGTGSVTVTNILDSDTMSGASATTLATSESIKAYVDSSGGGTPTSLGTITQDTVVFTSANADDPLIQIKNTTNDATGARLQFVKDKGGAGADGDDIGIIEFVGDDAAQTQTTFAKIVAEVSEADDTDEAGKLSFYVAESDGTTTALAAGLVLEGEHATDGQVDVTIAAGAASTTTIAGTLTMGSTAAMTNAGLLSVVNQSNITGLGTITSGVWNGTAINQTYLTGQSGTNTGDETLSSINSLSVTTVGTIDTGVWNGTAVASAYLDADTAHLTTDQTFTGVKQINKRKFTVTGTTHFETQGDIVYLGSGSTTAGELCYLKADGAWAATDADAVATSGGVLLALALGTDPDADGMLLRGMFTLDHSPGTIADELYVSTTAGDITGTAPSGTGDIVRVIGYCMDSTNGQIWFNPSNDFIVLA